jgi:putative colanic acid biosynthesis UDP-glucose lipid carrier transferase
MAWAGTLAGLLLLGYSLKVTHDLSRVTLGIWALSTPVALLIWRRLIRQSLKAMRVRGYNTRSVVILGVDENAKGLAKNIINMPWSGLVLKGFISKDSSGDVLTEKGESWSVIGGLEDLYGMARKNEVDIVYIAIPMHEQSIVAGILKELGDSTVSIFMVPDFCTAEIMQGTWVTVGDVPTVSVIDNPTQGMTSWVKRLEDIIISSFALIVLAIPMAIIALGIKLTSPGPVLYRQQRYGLSGKPICVWKFRSMSVMEEGSEFVQAKTGDRRVTKFGAFLRKTSLDELPQFFNVLGGSMSIVGPRPHAIAHNEEFRSKVNGYMLRHKVKPGITGLAQVNGYRGETDTEEKMSHRVRYDVEYINNWSVWLDLAIIFKTPMVLIRGENAY